MKRISTFSKRLKEYRNSKGYTLSELEKCTGIPSQTLNRYELEQRVPKVDVVNDIAEKLGLNTLWLQGFDINDNPTAKINMKDKDLSPHEKEVITAYRNNPPMQTAVDKLLGVSPETEKTYNIKIAARNGKFEEKTITDSELKKIMDLPDVDDLK